jgi:hypothetical protein
MEAMAITAGCRVWVSIEDGLSMDTLQIALIRVAGRTLLNDTSLVPFPGGYLVDLHVAVLTLNVVDEMGTGIVLRGFFLVATMTRERLEMDFGAFCQDVLIGVRDIQMATFARVCPMDRQRKFPLADLISMTAETFRVIHALRTVFLSLGGRLLSCFQGFGSFCLFGPIGALPLSSRVGCTD